MIDQIFAYAFGILIFCLIAAFIIAMIKDLLGLNIKKEIKADIEEKEIDNSAEKIDNNDDEYPYVRSLLLTKNEWRFYQNIKPIADKYNLHIIAKVRLNDLISVKKGLTGSKYYKALNKIISKHIDFVITRPENLAVLCAIELDDKSHQNAARQQRDCFIDTLCEKVGLPLIRTTGADGIEDKLCQTLKLNKK